MSFIDDAIKTAKSVTLVVLGILIGWTAHIWYLDFVK